MNFRIFFLTHKALRRKNEILRDHNARQFQMLENQVFNYEKGYQDAMAVCRTEMSLLHKEIQDLNDLVAAK